MEYGIFSNMNGDILIVHDQKLQAPVEWVEYDTQTEVFLLVYENGETFVLDIELSKKTKSNVSHGIKIIKFSINSLICNLF